jgi:hypothetical protein
VPRGAGMSLTLNQPTQVALYSNSSNNSEDAPKMERNY